MDIIRNMEKRKFAKIIISGIIVAIGILYYCSDVQAASFTARTTAPTVNDAYYYSLNPFYNSGYGMPNCTAYAYGRAYELLGTKPNLSTGNAGSWWWNNISSGAYSYGRTPKLGAIACWDNYDKNKGHVAVVENINGSQITISESHYQSTFFDVRTINADSSNYLTNKRFLGYIYIGDFMAETPGMKLSLPSNTNTFTESIDITFTWNEGDVGTTGYNLYIAPAIEGTSNYDWTNARIYVPGYSSTTYISPAGKLKPGAYAAYVEAWNINDDTKSTPSNFVYFVITKDSYVLETPVLSMNSSSNQISCATDITFSWTKSGVKTTGYNLYIAPAIEGTSNYDWTNARIYVPGYSSTTYISPAGKLKPGAYAAYVQAWNTEDDIKSEQSNFCFFMIEKHNWVKGKTIAPTTSEEGYTSYTCSVCGENKKADYVAKLVAIDTCIITIDGAPNSYDGTPKTPDLIVRDGNIILKKGVDYEVEYFDNIKVGNATIKVKGIGKYAGVVTRQFTIDKGSAQIIISEGRDSYTKTYGDTDFILEGITRSGDGVLNYDITAGSDAISLSGKIVKIKKTGTATITISMPETDNYKAAKTKAVNIVIQKASKAPNMPSPVIKAPYSMKLVGEVVLPQGWKWQEGSEELSLIAGKSINAVAEYIGVDKGNYKQETVEIAVYRQACTHKGTGFFVSNKKMATCTDEGYTGDKICKVCGGIVEYGTVVMAKGHTEVTDKAVKATCTKTGLTKGSHCSVCNAVIKKQERVAKKAHTYKTITTKATTNKNGSIVKKCAVCGNQASKSTIYYAKTITLSKTTFTYTGKYQIPKLTVKDSKGKTIDNKNYTVSGLKKQKNVGRYNVTVKFKGNYSGTKTLYFDITPKNINISGKIVPAKKSFTVQWKKQISQTSGYQVQYSIYKDFKKATIKTIPKNSTTSLKVTRLNAKKKYYVRVRTYKSIKINGKSTKIYSGWSKAKTVITKG